MQDHIIIGKSFLDGLYYAFLYQDHPTPSGSHRPILRLSTKIGRASRQEALNDMVAALDPEYLKTVWVPKLDDSEAT